MKIGSFKSCWTFDGTEPDACDVQAGYNPTLVGQAYDFPTNASGTTLDGTGQAIAILELRGGYNVSELNSYFNDAAPNVTAIGVDGGSNSPTNDPNEPDGEVELDIEVAGSIAPKAKIGVYFAPNTDQGFLDALTSAIHDTNLKPSVISISWGGPENTWTTQAMNAFDSAAQDAATMGVTIFAASGDNGATDGSDDGSLQVDFRASCPHITGCGGTKLALNGTTITSEIALNELNQREGATTLFSQSIGKPSDSSILCCRPQAAWPPSTKSRWEAMAGITVHQDGIPAPASEAPMKRNFCRSLTAVSRHQLRHKLRLLCDRATRGGSGCEAEKFGNDIHACPN